ncbi:hypothetical protein SLE2022_220420 [Rubroshorea leprosula]
MKLDSSLFDLVKRMKTIIRRHNTPDNVADSSGAPESPGCSRLASALHESIASGVFFGTYCRLDLLNNILKTITFELHGQEPYFTQLKAEILRMVTNCACID